jgi:hypothetical protein
MFLSLLAQNKPAQLTTIYTRSLILIPQPTRYHTNRLSFSSRLASSRPFFHVSCFYALHLFFFFFFGRHCAFPVTVKPPLIILLHFWFWKHNPKTKNKKFIERMLFYYPWPFGCLAVIIPIVFSFKLLLLLSLYYFQSLPTCQVKKTSRPNPTQPNISSYQRLSPAPPSSWHTHHDPHHPFP